MSAVKILPPQKYLRECFSYNKHTGVLTWRVRPRYHFANERAWKKWNTQFSGREAGSPASDDGYTRNMVGISNHRYYAHRLIWKLMTGRDPRPEVDHRDTDSSNNRWENLREATRMQNMSNRPLQRNNRLGIKGVHYDSRKNRFYAWIRSQRKLHILGCFTTAEAAKAAYDEAAKRLHGEFARP